MTPLVPKNLTTDGLTEYHTPVHIDPTNQYRVRKAKFTKWLEQSSDNLSC